MRTQDVPTPPIRSEGILSISIILKSHVRRNVVWKGEELLASGDGLQNPLCPVLGRRLGEIHGVVGRIHRSPEVEHLQNDEATVQTPFEETAAQGTKNGHPDIRSALRGVKGAELNGEGMRVRVAITADESV